jgi:triosephosphate isomerase (TIM)
MNYERKLIAGNWKMNLLREEAQWLMAEILGMLQDEEMRPINIAIIPPFVHIGALAQQASSEPRIGIGAQNCSDKSSGAFTGEVSAAMVKSVGGKYIIIGHSERRAYFNESDVLLAAKCKQVIENKLTPIFCCGEVLADRNSEKHFEVVSQQITNGVFDLPEEEFLKCVIAYEPVWAIGTGVTASADQAQEMHAFIRNLISSKYNANTAAKTTILYGGSCNDQNAKELFSLPDVDGGLIGGAALKSRSFVNIIKALPVY